MTQATADRLDVEAWAADPDISARSVLVTIFGDTVLPVTDSFWLAQLFRMTEVFGFSGRLIRTSMFRLAAEGWLTNERIGRQSRYSLTPLAVEESARASARIYQDATPDWGGDWTLVLTNGDDSDAEVRRDLARRLGWRGFIDLGGTLASPTADPDATRAFLDEGSTGPALAVATARFDDLDRLVGAGFFDRALDTAASHAAYRAFLDRYGPLAGDQPSDPLDAFAVRTALIHDLRRIRLRSPDLPASLLPRDHAGTAAHGLAAGLYRHLSQRCAPVLSEIFEIDYPTRPPGRFDDR
ncbi:MAG: PaaX family transcriptional regulator C-terminal domain-containing protein [Actinomycetota bacterium]